MIPVAIGILKPLSIELNPMIAALAMMLSSITVIINTLRLKRIKLERNK
jgi:cation transport ATPase